MHICSKCIAASENKVESKLLFPCSGEVLTFHHFPLGNMHMRNICVYEEEKFTEKL